MSECFQQHAAAVPSRKVAIVRRIAEALGVPEAAILNGVATKADIDAASEMLWIWHYLRNAADRQKLLALARRIAAAQD